MSSIILRLLTISEERRLRNNKGEEISIRGPLSIMGSSSHSFVNSTINSDTARLKREYLGSGDYIDELVGCEALPKGHTIPIKWSVDKAMHYVLFVAREHKIPHYQISGISDVVYLATASGKIFADCVEYVDGVLYNSYNSRSLFGRWFGSEPDWSSSQAKSIREKVGQILKNSDHNSC